MNTWPGGYRHAMHQNDHESWNASHYPGTRQICTQCDQPTGRCEDDTIYNDDGDPICPDCREIATAKGERDGCE
jgi:hypothetical protein